MYADVWYRGVKKFSDLILIHPHHTVFGLTEKLTVFAYFAWQNGSEQGNRRKSNSEFRTGMVWMLKTLIIIQKQRY